MGRGENYVSRHGLTESGQVRVRECVEVATSRVPGGIDQGDPGLTERGADGMSNAIVAGARRTPPLSWLSADWGGRCSRKARAESVLDANGFRVSTHPAPADRPTNCTFGGADMTDLDVTFFGGELYRVADTGLRAEA